MQTLTDDSQADSPEFDTAVGVLELLETVSEFAVASIELVAWEFSLDPSQIKPQWDDALGQGLLSAGPVDDAGETPCALTRQGAAMLAASPLPQAA